MGLTAKDAKKIVLERIMRDIGDQAGVQIVTFGDGPVEIRETRKRDGLAIGIASDEVRRHGWNREKRTRLIKSGAHIICPDFSEQEALWTCLGHTNDPMQSIR